MENRLDELASILEWVDDLALEPKWRLGPWHATMVDGRREVGGARNLDTLRARLSHFMVRRIRKEVLDQLPARTDTEVPVPLTAEQQEEHDALDQPIAAMVRRAKSRPLTQAEFLRLMNLLTIQRIICNGLAQLRFEEMWPTLQAAPRPTEALLRGLCSPKLVELREIFENVVLAQERKVVVFSQWRRMQSWRVGQSPTSCSVAECEQFSSPERKARREEPRISWTSTMTQRYGFCSPAMPVESGLTFSGRRAVVLR